MQVRWNYKLQPNKTQRALMSEWLVTLRKHRNYCLGERQRGYLSNNQDSDEPITYAYGAVCDIESRIEYGACCPLTCAVVKHGVMSSELTKISTQKVKENEEDNYPIGSYCDVKGKDAKNKPILLKVFAWGNASDIQSKRTSELRSENYWYERVSSTVLQGNLAKLDAAYTGFFKHERGFPAFRKASNFKTFQYKPGQATFTVNRSSKKKRCYSHVHLPGLGKMRYLDSRTIPTDADIRTVTVMKEADGWYISVLLELSETLPSIEDRKIESAVGIDVGINKLIALSDGSFVENPRFGTNKRIRRRLRIRQRRVNRKVKGSNNRSKAGVEVAKLHKKIADKRNDYNWKAAQKVVETADAVVREDLNIKGMKSRCKAKKAKGRFMPNGQSAKRGLNRSISDASWGDLFSKIGWLATKSGKPVLAVNPGYSSQECRSCGHTSKGNRSDKDKEKFLCVACGHIDHADTQASRTLVNRAEFVFAPNKRVRKDPKIRRTTRKCLPGDSRKVTPIIDSASPTGKRIQARSRVSKAMPESRIFEQLNLFGESSRL